MLLMIITYLFNIHATYHYYINILHSVPLWNHTLYDRRSIQEISWLCFYMEGEIFLRNIPTPIHVN